MRRMRLRSAQRDPTRPLRCYALRSNPWLCINVSSRIVDPQTIYIATSQTTDIVVDRSSQAYLVYSCSLETVKRACPPRSPIGGESQLQHALDPLPAVAAPCQEGVGPPPRPGWISGPIAPETAPHECCEVGVIAA